jgi:hypothetical protein
VGEQRGDVIDPAGGNAMRSIRMKISEGQLSEEPWYARLDEEARQQYRESAQPLFQGLMRYIAAGGTDPMTTARGAAEARAVGYEYARRAQRSGMHAAEAARAFLFFRDALLNSVIEVYQVANVPSGRAWGDVLRGVTAYTDLILMHLLETFERK